MPSCLSSGPVPRFLPWLACCAVCLSFGLGSCLVLPCPGVFRVVVLLCFLVGMLVFFQRAPCSTLRGIPYKYGWYSLLVCSPSSTNMVAILRFCIVVNLGTTTPCLDGCRDVSEPVQIRKAKRRRNICSERPDESGIDDRYRFINLGYRELTGHATLSFSGDFSLVRDILFFA